jgi:hypothetical protein
MAVADLTIFCIFRLSKAIISLFHFRGMCCFHLYGDSGLSSYRRDWRGNALIVHI